MLLAAFADDDGFRHAIPDQAARLTALNALFTIALRDAADQTRVAVAGDEIVGAGVWYAPGTHPMTRWRKLRAAPTMTLLALRIRRKLTPLARFGAEVERAFPTTPARYLQALGVRPDWQGRGVGGALLRDGLATADAADEDVYLETAEEANVGYYERFGFHVMDGSPAPMGEDGPVMWRMLRPAASRREAGDPAL